jgi:hypothetical protein
MQPKDVFEKLQGAVGHIQTAAAEENQAKAAVGNFPMPYAR